MVRRLSTVARGARPSAGARRRHVHARRARATAAVSPAGRRPPPRRRARSLLRRALPQIFNFIKTSVSLWKNRCLLKVGCVKRNMGGWRRGHPQVPPEAARGPPRTPGGGSWKPSPNGWREAPTEPVSLDQVARLARVSRSTIYVVFGSRAGLFDAFTADLWERTGWPTSPPLSRPPTRATTCAARCWRRGGCSPPTATSTGSCSRWRLDPDSSAARSMAWKVSARRHGAPRQRLAEDGDLRDDVTVERRSTCSGCCAASRRSTCSTPGVDCQSMMPPKSSRRSERTLCR